MNESKQEQRERGLPMTIRQPAPPERNTLSSSQLPNFPPNLILRPQKLEKETSSGTFCVPSATSSDEEDIQAQEKQELEALLYARSETHQFSFGTTSPHSGQFLHLGDSSSLFPDEQKDLPTTSNTFKFGTPQLEITTPFHFSSPSPPNMVVEREPPKASPQKVVQPPFAHVQQPQFGQPSPLQNRLQQKTPSVFNVPKPHQQRPEHHRSLNPAPLPQPRAMSSGQPGYMPPTVASTSPQPQSTSSGQPRYIQPTHNYQRPAPGSNEVQPQPQPNFMHHFQQSIQPQPQYQQPVQQSIQPQPQIQQPVQQSTIPSTQFYGNADVVEIPRPTNAPIWSSYPRPQPTFSAYGPGTSGFALGNGSHKPVIDLTGTSLKSQASLDPPGLFDDRFGASDPYMYVDAVKAAESIKALLEGAFEDEEDMPRTHEQKKKLDEKTDGLVDKLKGLAVKGDENKENIDKQEAEDDEDEDDVDNGTIEGLKIKLLPHQVEGVDWMREKEVGVKKKNGILPKGGILADDMGLGKTVQSISLILTNSRPPMTATSSSVTDKKALSPTVGRNTLVVAPLALIKQWEAEIKTKVEDSQKLKVLVHHGPQRTKSFQDLKKYDVVITTYQILVSEHGSSSTRDDGPQAGCFGIHWYRVILDEAHTIKNRNAKSTQACYALRSEYRWCLTGTPMQNNLDELQSLIKFLRIKPYNDLSVWKDQITRPMSQGRGGVAMKRLQFYLKAFMKRRTKEVLKKEGALNPGGNKTSKGGPNNGFKITERKVESLLAEFSSDERAFYNRLEQRTDKSLEAMMEGAKMSYASALVLLLRLRQACNHPKLLGGSLSKDNDALTTGQASPTKKSKAADKDIDDMADLLGGLSVQTKQCDVCQIDLSRDEVSAGLIRCSECEEDLAGQRIGGAKGRIKKHKKHHPSRKVKTEAMSKSQVSRAQKKNVIDSDEDEEGDWVVPEDQRPAAHLGIAGGSDDENAEGGGESLASLDTETGDESSIQILGSQRRKAISLDTDEEANNKNGVSSSEEEDEDTSDSEDSIPTSQATPTASAKIRHLLTLLHRESATYKFIVYSQFTSMLDLIEPFLRTAKLSFTRYDGSMRNDLREASLEKLRNDPSCRILLCSLKCGSLGLNLTAASRVVILEPFWNPFVEEQAIDRVHRLNQTVDVVVYKLTIKDTVEARILDLQEKKRALANAAIEGKAVGKLSMKDILNLFKRDAEHDLRHEEDPTLGMKTPMLTGSASAVASDLRAVSSRVSPPVMQNGKKSVGHRVEDSIYGRRW